jgi:hypothetical protein
MTKKLAETFHDACCLLQQASSKRECESQWLPIGSGIGCWSALQQAAKEDSCD